MPAFTCPYCDSAFETRNAIRVHIDEVHIRLFEAMYGAQPFWAGATAVPVKKVKAAKAA